MRMYFIEHEEDSGKWWWPRPLPSSGVWRPTLPALHAGHTDERQGPQRGAVQVDCDRGREIHCQYHPPEEVRDSLSLSLSLFLSPSLSLSLSVCMWYISGRLLAHALFLTSVKIHMGIGVCVCVHMCACILIFIMSYSWKFMLGKNFHQAHLHLHSKILKLEKVAISSCNPELLSLTPWEWVSRLGGTSHTWISV